MRNGVGSNVLALGAGKTAREQVLRIVADEPRRRIGESRVGVAVGLGLRVRRHSQERLFNRKVSGNGDCVVVPRRKRSLSESVFSSVLALGAGKTAC